MTTAEASEGASGPDQLIADTDWSALEVFVGPEEGCPTVPELFDTLLHGALSAKPRALYDLSEAINHQNSITETTAPAMRVIAALVTDPSTDLVMLPAIPHWTDTPIPLRAGLLRLMANVLDDVGLEAEAAGRRFAFKPYPAELQVRAIRPALIPAVLLFLDDPDVQVREAAAMASIPLSEDPELAPRREALTERAITILSSSADPRHRNVVAHTRGLAEDLALPDDGGCRDDPPF